eukprot:363353-Chlamydomonas_euryale.AAC.12
MQARAPTGNACKVTKWRGAAAQQGCRAGPPAGWTHALPCAPPADVSNGAGRLCWEETAQEKWIALRGKTVAPRLYCLAQWIGRGRPAHSPPHRPPGAERKGRQKGGKGKRKPSKEKEKNRKRERKKMKSSMSDPNLVGGTFCLPEVWVWPAHVRARLDESCRDLRDLSRAEVVLQPMAERQCA